MEGELIPLEIQAWLGDLGQGWTISASTAADGSWTVQLAHPASPGKVLETGAESELEALEISKRWLGNDDEIRIVAAAPAMAHPELCNGVRTLTQMYGWHNREVRGVAFLMYERGHLTEEETAWLAGYVGQSAPGQAASPLG